MGLRLNLRSLVGALCCFVLLLPVPAHTINDVVTVIKLLGRTKNVYARFEISVSRDALMRLDPVAYRRMLSSRHRESPGERCQSELDALESGFKKLHSDAPNPRRAANAHAWFRYVQMVHFPDLLLCVQRSVLRKALDDLQTQGLTFPRIKQHISPITFDFDSILTEPEAISDVRYYTSNFLEYSLMGHPPAMVDLVKIGARGDIIRLTPEFNYYLLAVARDAGVLDDETRRLLAEAGERLDAGARDRIDSWARERKWPLKERIAVD